MPDPPSQAQLSRIVASELVDAALAIAGFKIAKRDFASAANISGIRSKTQTFSSRHDSRTHFASDNRYGPLGKAGTWTGDDRTIVAACRRALRAAKVPPKETVEIDVVLEMGREAQRVSGEKFRMYDPLVLRKLARARRAVEGIPVWSSYAMVGLTGKGEVGSLELHWPELPSAVVKEAAVLQALVKRIGFRPPEVADARVETVAAGVIHSPAVGFHMDVVPVVRVIYAASKKVIGRKPTLYLDRHGRSVSMPRDIEPAKHEPVSRQSPATSPPPGPVSR
jgi:hypothetical protein